LLWLEHPRYIRTRDDLIARIRSERYRFRRHGLSIFLCGGAGSSRRHRLREYLLKHVNGLLGVFYAERVWEHIAAHGDQMTALEMEAELAKLADVVIVIVESPGTFAELGAFSLSNELRAKILPIVDRKYKGEESFILTGPIRWIDRDSDFRPTIFAPFDTILDCVGEVEARIKRAPKPKSMKVANLSTSRKHLLFFLCDIVAVTYPVTIGMLEYYIQQIVAPKFDQKIEIATLVGLAESMDLLRSSALKFEGTSYRLYAPASSSALASPYHHRMMNDLPTQRANHLSALLMIPDAQQALAAFNEKGE
jgi:hypothetical protein